MKTWNCEILFPPQSITVGTKLKLSCKGEVPPLISQKKLSIIFPKKEDAYRLHILKTLDVQKNHIHLEVVPYRTGLFNGSFTVTDGSQSFLVDPLSLKIDSVLSKNQKVQPQGSFGPWEPPLPFWYLSFFGVNIILFVSIVATLCYKYFQRKHLVQLIDSRLTDQLPSQIFIRQLRRLDKKAKNYVLKLENLFHTFLENLLYISTVKKTSHQILKDCKKYSPDIYKIYGDQISQILKELHNFKTYESRKSIRFQLEKSCKELAFLLETAKYK